MKFLNQHKFLIACGVAAVMAFFCLRFFMQAVKTDHSLELYKQKMDYQEHARQAVIKERMAWEELMLQQTKQIIEYRLKDSLVSLQSTAVANKIQTISTNHYVKQKIATIADYSDADLQQYFNNLPAVPEPNDY